MSSSASPTRGNRTTTIAVLIVAGAAFLGYQSLTASSSLATSPISVKTLTGHLHGDLPGAPGGADDVVPEGTTVFDDDVPAVAKLNPNLLHALRQAATDAAGVEFDVNSGWRSRKYQEQLFREAVAKYGSKKEAARWVAIPGTSAHESGDAVDIGSTDATAWLSRYGAAYGLCRIYGNEPWHFELRPDAVDHGCPPMYADAAHDPRMRQ